MDEFDLDRAILKDRNSPVPGQPDTNTTLAAVRHMRLEKGRTATRGLRGRSTQEPMALGVSGAAIALGIAWILSSSGSPYLLLVIPSIELVVLKALIKEETKS